MVLAPAGPPYLHPPVAAVHILGANLHLAVGFAHQVLDLLQEEIIILDAVAGKGITLLMESAGNCG